MTYPFRKRRGRRARRGEVETILGELGTLAGTRVIEGHGDLHVGQVLRSDGRFVVTDFDGNPVLPARSGCCRYRRRWTSQGWRSRWSTPRSSPASTPISTPQRWQASTAAAREAFLGAYGAVAPLGHAELSSSAPLHAFRTQQVLREIVYAARHLPRWMYVPDAALPALLDEGSRS